MEEEKIQFQKDKEKAERRAEKAEAELKKLEDRREFLQPVMDNVSKEIKEYGMIKTFLPEATALERAITYRDKKIKPLFIEMKNKIGALAFSSEIYFSKARYACVFIPAHSNPHPT